MLGGSQADIQQHDSELKKYGLLTLGIVIVGITLTAGVTAAYLIAAVAGLSAAILYPQNIEEWFNAHRMLLIGSLVGFFIGGASLGPITMVLGGFLGYLIEQPVNLAVNAANKTVDAYQKVSNGVSQVTELPNNAWNSLKSGFEKSYRFFAGEIKTDDKAEFKTEPKSHIQVTTPTPTPVKNNLSKASPEIVKVTATKTTLPAPNKNAVQPLPVKHRLSRVQVKRVKEPLGAKPTTPSSSQSLWQSFCGFFVTPTPVATAEAVLDNKAPSRLPLKKHLSRTTKTAVEPNTKRHKPRVALHK